MALLENVKKVVIINAGHWDNPNTTEIEDAGAVYGVTELSQNIAIRDALVPILAARGYKVLAVPDHLDLRKSIAWANQQAPKLRDALAIDIHLNANRNSTIRGAEAYYGTSRTSKKIAAVLSKHIAKELGVPDRGARPDSQTFVGSLGWIRKTTMWASLVEVVYMTNDEDMQALLNNNGHHKAALGIANAVVELFEGEAESDDPEQPEEPIVENPLAGFTIKQLLAELRRRIFALGKGNRTA